MTDRAVFSDSEWNLLVRLPRWVVLAASAAQPDRGRRTAGEEEAGLIAVAQGRESASAFVATIAGLLVDSFDDPDEGTPIDFGDAEAGIATVFERTESAARLLAAKADGADSAAYREWLVAIADIVVGSARSGDVLGVGGDVVTSRERRFREQLASILQS